MSDQKQSDDVIARLTSFLHDDACWPKRGDWYGRCPSLKRRPASAALAQL